MRDFLGRDFHLYPGRTDRKGCITILLAHALGPILHTESLTGVNAPNHGADFIIISSEP